MAYTNKLRISNVVNYRNQIVKLSRIKVWVDNTEVAISNITSNYTASNLLELTNNSQIEAALLTGSLGHIELQLDENVYVEQFIYIQLETQSSEEYWPVRFDISYDYNNSDDWRHYMIAGDYIYPGIDTLTELPIMSAGAVNKSVTWSNVGSNFPGTVSELETRIYLTPEAARADWGAQTNQTPTTGKWYVEVYTEVIAINQYFDFGIAPEKTEVELSGTTGMGTVSAPSIYYRAGRANIQMQYGNNQWDNITSNATYLSTDYTGTVNADALLELQAASIFGKIGYGLLIDLDNQVLTFTSLNTSVRYSFAYSFDNLDSSVRALTVGGRTDHAAVLPEHDPYINLGYHPFIGRVPEGYTPGFGVETSVTNPAWTKLEPNQIPMHLPDTSHDVHITTFDVDKAYTRQPTIVNPEPTTQKTVNIAPVADIVLESLAKTVEFVLEKPKYLTIKHIGPIRTTGYGYIKSTVSKVMGSTVPIRTRVVLMDIQLNKLVAATMSHPETGEFEFTYLDENIQFNVLAYDPALGWVTGVGGPWKAVRMPGYENRVFERILTSYDS